MKQQVIVIRGPLGVGKTSISKLLLDELKNKAKRLAYIPIDVSIYPYMRNYFQLSRKERTEIMQENLELIFENFLKRKFTIVVEGIFTGNYNKKSHLERLYNLAKKYKTKISVIELHADLKTLHKRVKDRKKKNPFAWNNPKETEHKYGKFMKALHKDAIIINTEKKSLKKIVKEILEKIK